MASPAYKVHEAIEDTQPSFQSLFKVPVSNNALAMWQSDVIKAIEGFLTIVKEKVVEIHSLSKSSLLISYAPDTHREIETGALILKQCFAMVGVSATISAVTTSEALNLELNQYQQAIVLCTPLYAQKVAQDLAIRTVLDSFGKKRSDSLHTILCQGAFSDALKVVDGHFLIRAYQEAFSDNTYNALQTFIDVFLEVSGNQGLGLLPDVLDLEKNEQFDARAGYLSALTVLHQTIIQLTIDYRLRESMEKSARENPLKSYLDLKDLPIIKQTPGFEPIVQELLETPAKVSLLLCPTIGDTELASLALTEHFLGQKNLRVLSIECADYPGKAAADCVRLAFEELKLKTAHLDAAREKPLIILLKGYEQFGIYDNLIVKNKLPSFANVKVFITCKADFFKFRGYLSCFLSDVSNRRVDDILVHKVPAFASIDAKKSALSITRQPKVLETTEAVLLSPKRRAQQEELKSFLKNLNQIWVREGYLQADIQQNPQIFVSYAWEGDKASLARQQRHLLQLSQDLTALGFPTWLDIERMTGDINEQMAGNIANSRVVLVIGTPRYPERAAQPTNVQKEFIAISKKAQEDLSFSIFPLEFLRVANVSSFPSTLQSHPNHCDFTGIDDGSDYLQRMTDPVHGLIAKLLLDTPAKRELYEKAHANFQDQLQLLAGKHLIVNQGQDDTQTFDMDNRLKGYIEPFGLYNEASPLDTRFDLQKHFQGFLDKPDSKTAIVLGRAGSGKSLFALSTFKTLLQPWHEYRNGSTPLPTWLPVYIQLRNYANDPEHCIENALRQQFGLTFQDIEALKQGLNHNQRILFICDGIDELGSGVYPNLSQSVNDWPLAKVLVTGRPEHFDRDHQPLDVLSLRSPGGRMILNSTQLVYVSPFSPDEIQRYVVYHDKGKNEDTYQTLQKLPGMMALLDNPFLLTLVLQSLPQLLKNREGVERAVTRADIYQAFIETWFLQETKGRELDPKACERFSEELAFRFFKAKTISVSNTPERKDLWDFFSSEANQAVQDASPLRFSGGEFSFVHKSIWEFLVAMRLWKAIPEPDCLTLWQERPLTEERPVIDFLAEIYQTSYARSDYETRLFELVKSSREESFPVVVSSNAITILNAARVPFSGMDLKGIRVPRADLTGAILDNTNLEDTDFSNVTLTGAWLSGANLKNALLNNLFLGEYPNLMLKNDIKGCCFSPDGKVLAVATGCNIEIYDIKTRSLLKTLEGHTTEVKCLHFSPNGELLASGSWNNTVKLWRVENGILQNILIDHSSAYSVCFSPDGKLLATGSYDNTIKLWNVEDGELQKTLKGHTRWVSSVCFSPDGALLASGSDDNTIKLWNVEDGELQKTLEAAGERHTNGITSICFSPDGTLLASGSNGFGSDRMRKDNTVKLWNVEIGKLQKTLEGHTNGITSVCFSPDGRLLASGSDDKTVRLWDVKDSRFEKILAGYVDCMQFSPDGKLLAGSSYKTVRLWKVGVRELQKSMESHADEVHSLQFSPDGRLLVSGSDDNTIKLWNVENGKLQKTFTDPAKRIRSVCFSPSGKLLASSSWDDNTIKLWTIEDGKIQKILTGHDLMIPRAHFSPNGELLASGSWDNTVKLWRVENGTLQNTLTGHSSEVYNVCFSPDGRLLASGSYECVKLWNVENGELQNTLTGQNSEITSLYFSSDGKLLVSGGGYGDNSVNLWDMQSGRLQKILKGHANQINSLYLSPDDKLLASASEDGAIRVWEWMNIEKSFCYINPLLPKTKSLTFTQTEEETFLATGHGDGSIRYWKLRILDHKFYLQLLWSSSQNELVCQVANLEGVKGLSIDNRDLLKQRGAIGHPLIVATSKDHPDWSLLHLAVANNDHEKISQLIQENPACLEEVSDDGSTALHVAVRYNVQVVEYLVNKGANRIARNSQGNWPGQLVVDSYQEEALAYLPVEDKKYPGQIFLHQAAEKGYESIIVWVSQQSRLKKINVDLNFKNKEGETAIHTAAASGQIKVLKLLKEEGADLIARDNKGDTPLHFAVNKGQLETVEWMLEQRINVELGNNNGETAIHTAAFGGKLELLKLFKKQGASLLVKDSEGFAPLHVSAFSGQAEVIEWLLEQGVAVELKNEKAETAVYIAAKKGQMGVLKLLKEREADLIARDNKGNTPLHAAVYNNKIQAVGWLLEQGVFTELKNNAGEMAIHIAAGKGYLEMLKFLKKRGANLVVRDNRGNTPIHAAVYNNQIQIVEWLLEQGISVELKDNEGLTAAHVAAYHKHIEILKLLKAHGADLLAKDTISPGGTPLHRAAAPNAVKSVEWLLDEGIFVDVLRDDDSTPLHRAAVNGANEVVQLLLQRGANPNARNKDGKTPAQLAYGNGKEETAKLIEQAQSLDESLRTPQPITFASIEILNQVIAPSPSETTPVVTLPVIFSAAAQALGVSQERRNDPIIEPPVVEEVTSFNDRLKMWQSRTGGVGGGK